MLTKNYYLIIFQSAIIKSSKNVTINMVQTNAKRVFIILSVMSVAPIWKINCKDI